MKINYQIFLFFLLFVIPLNNVFASSDIYVKCPDGGGVGTVVDCELFATSDIEISAVRIKLSVSNNLEFVSFKTDSSWQGNGDNGDIALYTYPNQIGKIKLGIVTVKIKESNASRTGTLYFQDVYFYKADFSGVSGASVSKNIKVLSSNNDLASLSLVGYNISPNFQQDITEYKAFVDNNTVVIDASSKDEFASISGVGRKKLNYGENAFTITVTSEVGDKKIYKLIITRPSEKKEENQFTEEKYDHQNIDANQKKEDEKIEVEKDGDSKLKSLVVDGYAIDFHGEKYRYDIEVSSHIDKLEIIALPNSEKAKVTIQGNEDISVGKNEITITVVAEDGSKNIYTIYAIKKSNVCFVKSIQIKNYDFVFDCNQYDYELQIGSEDSLNIDIIPVYDQAKVHIFHNDNLKNGSIITIKVGVDDIDYEYHIKVVKNDLESGSIVNDKKFIVLVFITIFTSLYFSIRFLVKKKILNGKKSLG